VPEAADWKGHSLPLVGQKELHSKSSPLAWIIAAVKSRKKSHPSRDLRPEQEPTLPALAQGESGFFACINRDYTRLLAGEPALEV
jgi:hypothetical protein